MGFRIIKINLLLFVCLCFLLSATFHVGEGSSESCSAESTAFYCPACGGIEVSDCLDCEGYLQTDLSHKMCIKRILFQRHNEDTDDPNNHYHFLWNDLLGAIIWFIVSGVAVACGVGGGGVYVPLGILLFQFAPKPSSGLSQASIFGASLGGLLLNARQFHPEEKIRDDPGVVDDAKGIPLQKVMSANEEKGYVESRNGMFYTRPIIDYDMALFLSPMQMAGAVLGVLVQKILPNWLYLLLAALVLSVTAYKTYQKFNSVRAQEKRKAEEQEKKLNSDGARNDRPHDRMEPIKDEVVSKMQTAASTLTEDETYDPETASDKDLVLEDSPEAANKESMHQDEGFSENTKLELRRKYLNEDMVQYPKDKIVTLVVLWIGLVILTLMEGGKGVESPVSVSCESPWYGVLVASQFLWMFGFAIFFARRLEKKQAARVAVDYPYLPHDPVWSRSNIQFYGGMTFVAGVVAGFIGIGGGMILGPLMLIMDIHPQVSSAVNATMVVLTSSTVAVMFVTSGLIPWSYAVFYFFVCFFGALIGKSQIDKYIKRTGKASILIFILATITALATVGCLVILFLRLADAQWCLDGLNKFCSVASGKDCPIDRVLNFLGDSD